MKNTIPLACLLLAAAVPSWAKGDPPDLKNAHVICNEAFKNMKILLEDAQIGCTPAADGPGAFSLVFIAVEHVYDSPGKRKAYMTILAGAVGDSMNRHPATKIRNVGFMDRDLGDRRRYVELDAKEVARLQREIKADRMTLDQFYAGIQQASVEKEPKPGGGAPKRE